MVMVLLSMVAQGSSCGGDEEGRRWCPFLSFLFLPCFCFIPSPFLSFSFSVLCPFVSFLFLSSLSLFLSLPSSSILKQPPPPPGLSLISLYFSPPLFPSLYIIPSISNYSLNLLSMSFSPLCSLSLWSSQENSLMSSLKLSCKSPPLFVLPTLVFIRGKWEKVPYHVQLRRKGRVAGQPLCNCP
jgi:hypothetical protein